MSSFSNSLSFKSRYEPLNSGYESIQGFVGTLLASIPPLTGGVSTMSGSYEWYTVGSNIYSTGAGNTSLSNTGNFAAMDNAGINMTGASYNVLIGVDAGESLTDGSMNIVLGNNALEDATTSSQNIAIGSSSMRMLATGSTNTAVGIGSMYNTAKGDGNVSIGYLSLASFGETESNVNSCVAVGSQSLYSVETGAGGDSNRISEPIFKCGRYRGYFNWL